jgi:hypothetical protein
MEIVKYYLEVLQKNKEDFAVDSFPKDRIFVKKKRRTLVVEKGDKKSEV